MAHSPVIDRVRGDPGGTKKKEAVWVWCVVEENGWTMGQCPEDHKKGTLMSNFLRYLNDSNDSSLIPNKYVSGYNSNLGRPKDVKHLAP